MAVVMLLSMAVTPAMAADTQDPPTAMECAYTSGMTNMLTLTVDDSTWLAAVAAKRATLTINELTYTYKDDFGMFCSDPYWHVKGNNIEFVVTSSYSFFPAVFTLSADGYKDVKITVSKTGYYPNESVSAVAEIVGGSGSEEMPDTGKTAPTAVKYAYSSMMPAAHYFGADSDWLSAITGVQVNGTAYEKGSVEYNSSGNHWNIGKKDFNGYGAEAALVVLASSSVTYPAKFAITATDYPDVVIQVDKKGAATATIVQDTPAEYTVTAATDIENGTVKVSSTSAKAGDTVTVTATPADGYELDTITVTGASGTAVAVNDSKFTMPAENVTVSAAFKVTPPATGDKEISLSQVKLSQDMFGSDWYVTFGETGYVSKVSKVTVNGTEWEAKDSGVSSGGAYKKDTENNLLEFAAKDFSPNPTIPVLKSGDVITITAEGYKDLTMKFVVDADGKASLVADDGQGDPLELHVKIEGSFEAAIVGQKNYDGVSSASVGGASSNKNSAVTVYGALTKNGTKPADSDWQKLESYSSKINLVGSKCKVNIVPDTSKGTSESADSGMEGVYMTISSDLTLNGTPKDPGSYLISIHVEDDQGRTADSNELPFRIYTGDETLADQIKVENLKEYQSGLYAWDIMEPWAIKNFGSNVEGKENSVCVPKDLEVWSGSHTSGTYGVLGNDIAWDDVKAGNIPQTLYIPEGCNLTLMNMKILSSVRIVVENGGKLTLRDSTVQGIIDVQSGGTFSMNYDSYNQTFETGASICGQLRMESGSTLENAAIYSHTNYLANGNLTDRSNDEAVVLTTGNVTVKGQVFISGDDAGGTEKGQTALKVQNGTLTLEDGAVLAAYGGGGETQVYTDGGSAIELDSGTISGNGKVIALGGSVLFGSGSSAVSGTGRITTTEAYIQGATAYNRAGKNAQPGKSHDASVAINSGKKYVANGTLVDGTNDPLADLYWKTGIDATPELSKYEIPANSGYVLMNIPYAEFYAAEKDANGTAAQVDAVSSATKQKTRSTLAAGSYHTNADGTDISGVIYPVYVPDLSALRDYKQVKDSDTLTITVTLKGKEITTPYTGKDTLFENPDYAYYVLSEVPKSYKTLTVKSDGSFSFGKATAKMTELGNTSVSLKTGSHRAYYKLEVSGNLPKNIKSMVSAVTLHTTDGQTYGLRHVAEIWHGTKLGFGVDSGLQDKTINKITYYLNDGTIQTIAANIKVPKSTQNVTATVENALNTARKAVVTVENLPEDFDARYEVASGSTDLSAYNFKVEGEKLTWTGTPAFGAYTLTITDANDVYAPVSTSFELKTADVIAKYDASNKALVKASDAITEEQFAAYLKAISAVSVDGTSYAASDKGAVTIIKNGGVIDLTAQPFSKGEGASYNLVVKATGYQDLTFTVTTAKKSNSGSGSSSSGSSGSSYAVSAPSTKNGDVTVSPKNASKGDRVTVTVTPDKGYELDKLTVKDASGNKLKLTDKGNGKYTFTMPGSKVTVSAEFVEEQAASIFADVPTDAYYAKAVEWAVKKNITNGKANGLFGSNDPCTRGQIVTFLWRAAGSPAPKDTATVPADVLPGSYCYDAVAWALENGITNGLADGTFGVNSTCTRGQSVTFLYRALGKAPTTVNGFTDVAADAFCADAVAWAVESGVTNGTSASAFSPNAGCTRAQIVTFLYRAYQGK